MNNRIHHSLANSIAATLQPRVESEELRAQPSEQTCLLPDLKSKFTVWFCSQRSTLSSRLNFYAKGNTGLPAGRDALADA